MAKIQNKETIFKAAKKKTTGYYDKGNPIRLSADLSVAASEARGSDRASLK